MSWRPAGRKAGRWRPESFEYRQRGATVPKIKKGAGRRDPGGTKPAKPGSAPLDAPAPGEPAIPVKGTAGEYIRHAGKSMLDFRARAGRAEYWWTYLCFAGIAILLAAIVVAAIIFIPSYMPELIHDIGKFVFTTKIISLAIAITFFFSILGVSIRRFHDAGLSGWVFWLSFLPYLCTKIPGIGHKFSVISYIGGLFCLVIFLLPSKGPNKYGDGPWRPALW